MRDHLDELDIPLIYVTRGFAGCILLLFCIISGIGALHFWNKSAAFEQGAQPATGTILAMTSRGCRFLDRCLDNQETVHTATVAFATGPEHVIAPRSICAGPAAASAIGSLSTICPTIRLLPSQRTWILPARCGACSRSSSSSEPWSAALARSGFSGRKADRPEADRQRAALSGIGPVFRLQRGRSVKSLRCSCTTRCGMAFLSIYDQSAMKRFLNVRQRSDR